MQEVTYVERVRAVCGILRIGNAASAEHRPAAQVIFTSRAWILTLSIRHVLWNQISRCNSYPADTALCHGGCQDRNCVPSQPLCRRCGGLPAPAGRRRRRRCGQHFPAPTSSASAAASSHDGDLALVPCGFGHVPMSSICHHHGKLKPIRRQPIVTA